MPASTRDLRPEGGLNSSEEDPTDVEHADLAEAYGTPPTRLNSIKPLRKLSSRRPKRQPDREGAQAKKDKDNMQRRQCAKAQARKQARAFKCLDTTVQVLGINAKQEAAPESKAASDKLKTLSIANSDVSDAGSRAAPETPRLKPQRVQSYRQMGAQAQPQPVPPRSPSTPTLVPGVLQDASGEFSSMSDLSELMNARQEWHAVLDDVLEGNQEDLEPIMSSASEKAQNLRDQLIMWQTPPEPTWPARQQHLNWLDIASANVKEIFSNLRRHWFLLEQQGRITEAMDLMQEVAQELCAMARLCCDSVKEGLHSIQPTSLLDVKLGFSLQRDTLHRVLKLVHKIASGITTSNGPALGQSLGAAVVEVVLAGYDATVRLQEAVLSSDALTGSLGGVSAHEINERARQLQSCWEECEHATQAVTATWPHLRNELHREWCRMYVSAAQAAESMQACAPENGSQAGGNTPDGDLGGVWGRSPAETSSVPSVSDEDLQAQAWFPGILTSMLHCAEHAASITLNDSSLVEFEGEEYLVEPDSDVEHLIDSMSAAFFSLAATGTVRVGRLCKAPQLLACWALELLEEQACNAILFVRDLDTSLLGQNELGLENFDTLRKCTDDLVNDILHVRQLLKRRRRLSSADGDESCEPPKRLLGVVKPVPSARRNPHVNPYTGFASPAAQAGNPGLRTAAGFYSQQPVSTQAGVAPRSSQLTAGLRANGAASAAAARAQGSASAAAARAHGSAAAAAARAHGSAAAAAARAQGSAVAAAARGSAAAARVQGLASAATARGSAAVDRANAAAAAANKPPIRSGAQRSLLPVPSQHASHQQPVHLPPAGSHRLSGQSTGTATAAGAQSSNKAPPPASVQAKQVQDPLGLPTQGSNAAGSQVQQPVPQSEGALPAADASSTQSAGQHQQSRPVSAPQAVPSTAGQATKPSYASKVALSAGAAAPQTNPRHRQRHKHHHHKGKSVQLQAGQLDAALARQPSQLNPNASPFLAQASAAAPQPEQGRLQDPSPADEPLGQQDASNANQQLAGGRLEQQQPPRQSQRQRQHPPFRDTRSTLASPFLTASAESSSAESSLGMENRDPALQQAHGHKPEQQKVAPVRPSFMASPFTALDTLPSFTKPVSPSKALEFPSAFGSHRSPDRRASASSSSSPAGSPAQVLRSPQPAATGHLPSAVPAVTALRATAPSGASATASAATQQQHPPTVATLAALNGGLKSEPPSPTTPLALALQSTSDGIAKKASSGRAPSTCSDIGFGLLWDDDPFWQLRWEDIQPTLVRQLGKGSFGHVFEGWYHSAPMAVKVMNVDCCTGLSSRTLQLFKAEVDLQRKLSFHPNIVRFIGACCQIPQQLIAEPASPHDLPHLRADSLDTSGVKLAIVMELCRFGTFNHLIELARKVAHLPLELRNSTRCPRNPEEAKLKASPGWRLYHDWPRRLQLAHQAAAAVEFMHSHNVVHRDLTSNNLLVTDKWEAKVGDFNLSRAMKTDTIAPSAAINSPAWSAPERLQGLRYGKSADVFSFGVILWELITLGVPWREMGDDGLIDESRDNFFVILNNVLAGNCLPCPATVEPVLPELPLLTALMERCWKRDPSQRPAMAEVAQTMYTITQAVRRRSKQEQAAQVNGHA